MLLRLKMKGMEEADSAVDPDCCLLGIKREGSRDRKERQAPAQKE